MAFIAAEFCIINAFVVRAIKHIIDVVHSNMKDPNNG